MDIEVKRASGTGATYTADWITIPDRCKQILAMWLSHDNLREYPRTKEWAYQFCKKVGLKTTTGAFFARVSELVGVKALISCGETKSSPVDTDDAPRYYVNLDRAVYLLNGGKLK